MKKYSRKQKRQIMIISGAFFYLIALFLPHPLSLALFILSYGILGRNIFNKVIKNLHFSTIFDENFLMLVATLGAVALSQFEEAVAVLLFYQVGEYFQDQAVAKSRQSIADLMDINPDSARLIINEIEQIVDPSVIKVGEIIRVKPGEKIACDGYVVKGSSSVDTKMLTGESLPITLNVGMKALSGTINLNSVIDIEVSETYETSTVSKILELVEMASSRKSKSENFISTFARYYTPIVVILAFSMAVFIPIITQQTFSIWIYRALVFLVVSCPCALVLSIPLSFFAGIGGASRQGILIKGGNYLEALSHTDTVVFDKTGTLTKGEFVIEAIDSFKLDSRLILEKAAYAEAHFNHPIALSIQKAFNQKIDEKRILKVIDIAGKGIVALIDEDEILVGNAQLLEEYKVKIVKEIHSGTELHVVINHKHEANILLSDQIKDDAYLGIQKLHALNIENIIMLSGDKEESAQKVARQLNIKTFFAQCLPQDKVSKVEELILNKAKSSKVVFVGDGINDAPVLAMSDIGIAMGALGSDAAIEAADVVILNDEVSKVSDVIKHAKRTMFIVKQNIVFALGVKIGTLVLASFGLANMWLAIFADVGVALLAVLNASRILKFKK